MIKLCVRIPKMTERQPILLSEDEFEEMLREQRELAEAMKRDSLRQEELSTGVCVKCFVSTSKGRLRQRKKPRDVALLVLNNSRAFDLYGKCLEQVVDQLATECFPGTPPEDAVEKLYDFVERRIK